LGATAHYALEAVRSDGSATRYGPISTEDSSSQVTGPGPSELPFGESAIGIVYGEPTAISRRTVAEGPHNALVEVTVGGFFATVGSDGAVGFHLPRVLEGIQHGAFSLPVVRILVDGARNRGIDLEVMRAQGIVYFDGLASTDEAKVALQEQTSEDEQAPGMQPVRIVRVDAQGAVTKALVEFAPLRWNPLSERLTLSRRIVVRLIFPENIAPDFP
jgi:hypothetical protein